MTRTVVGVLRGGPSHEYDVSLKTGASILNALPEDQYNVHDIFIDRAGQWHHFGRPVEPMRALHSMDVVVNGLHGAYGEDGTVQRLLELSGVPYTGPRPEAAALSMHKQRTKELLRRAGVRVPNGLFFALPTDATTGDMTMEVFHTFAPPYIVKPSSSGSSVGVYLASTINDLNNLLGDALDDHQSVLIEEYIPGAEATVGVVNHFRGEEVYALPPIEIILDRKPLFDYGTKYHLDTKELCPSTFSHDIKRQLEKAARTAHQVLGLTHYSRSDFRVHPRGPVYFLETNSLPGLTETSLIPKALQAVGSSLKEFLTHVINRAIGR